MQEEEYFKKLLVKFLAGEIIDSEITVLRSFLDKDPESRRIFDHENELWQKIDIYSRHNNYKTDDGWDIVASKLKIDNIENDSIFIISKRRFIAFTVAAAIACLMTIGWFGLWLKERHSVESWTTISTTEGEMANICLTDSTQVTINSASSFKYPTNFNLKERTVKLSGEAYFNVYTNPEKPFIVQLDKMIVSVSGTKFNVFSYPNEGRIETTLVEGKIQIDIEGQKAIHMNAGQQVVYFTQTGKTILRNVNTETYSSWKENKLRLIDTPFEEALIKIARKYNVTFEIRNSDILDLNYTATFIDESIEEVMQMLQTISPIRYQIINRTSTNDEKYLKPKIIIKKK
jgi:ferric-dicitrate binding protein FerR (iron transport regulator)